MNDVMDEDIVDLSFPTECLPAVDELLKRHRKHVIEECARVAETWHVEVGDVEDIAAAIRALKDKTAV